MKVGNNITADVKKLHKDFKELNGGVGPFAELTSLTAQPLLKRSLASLVRMVSGMEMDKDVGGGALFDWRGTSLPAANQQYAAADAWAGLHVWLELTRKKAGIGAPLGQEEEVRTRGVADGLGAGTSAPDATTAPAAEPSGAGVAWDSGLGDAGRQGGGEQAVLDLHEDVRAEVEVGVSPLEWLESCEDDDEEVVPVDDSVHSTTPDVSRR